MTPTQQDFSFLSDGTVLRGTLWRPADPSERPAIVMAHGFTAVAAQLEPQARAFAEAGFAAYVFDHPGFGRSEGLPRQEVDPARQVRAFRDAVGFVMTQPGVKTDAIGLWGSSMAGGHVIQAGALDPAVRAVVAQSPFVSGWRLVQARRDADAFVAGLMAERRARNAGAAPTLIPVVAPERAMSALPGNDAHAYFTSLGQGIWRNEVTLSSFELVRAHEPGHWLQYLAKPLLMIVADADVITPTRHALDAFATATGPKRLLMVPGGHFAVYDGEGFTSAVGSATEFFAEVLGRPG
jgi:hypothetical protein